MQLAIWSAYYIQQGIEKGGPNVLVAERWSSKHALVLIFEGMQYHNGLK